MAHRRSFKGGGGISDSQRRKKTWITLKVANGATGSSTLFNTVLALNVGATPTNAGGRAQTTFGVIDDQVSGLGDEVSSLPDECTILRARGSLLFPKNVPGALVGMLDQHVFGFGVTDIRSIVNASVPGPITDGDWDGWMFLRQSSVSPLDSMGTIVDVKAMRKIKTGDAFFLTAETVAATSAGSPAADYIFDLRLLILLP